MGVVLYHSIAIQRERLRKLPTSKRELANQIHLFVYLNKNDGELNVQWLGKGTAPYEIELKYLEFKNIHIKNK